ncbi:MAG TPA: CHAT domain-containing protein [Allocoleopsis sp.]
MFSLLKRTSLNGKSLKKDRKQNKRLKPKTLFILLFVLGFCLAQEVGWFVSVATLPVSAASSPTSVTVVQGSANSTNLLQRGKALYDAGKFSEAVDVLQQAVTAFKNEGNVLRQATALSNLALAYQQLGSWSQAEQAIAESLTLLQSGGGMSGVPQQDRTERSSLLAQTLNIQGRLQFSLGKAEQALNTWQQTATTYSQIGNQEGLAQSQINQAQALQALGLYPRACKILLNTLGIENQDCRISDTQVQAIKKQPDSLTKAVALRGLGDVLQLVGDLKQSEEVLRQSLEIAQRLKSDSGISATLFSLGNTLRAQQNSTTVRGRPSNESAIAFYQQAAELSPSPLTAIQAQLNQLSLLLDAQRVSEAQALWPQILSRLASLPPSRATVYARINLAQSLLRLPDTEVKQAAQLLAAAIQQAKSIGDQRASAYALGNLGELYEKTGQVNNAKELTDQALLVAQTINASDIAYRWQWQLGRLLKAQGDRVGAIAAYDSAIKTLQDIRGDLVSINPDVQFSFRESVEPVYRQYVGLLLQSDDAQNLERARKVIESLQLAELVNFFRENCLAGQQVNIDQIDPNQTTAVVYPIVLNDRLEVVLSLPKTSTLRHYTTRISQDEAEAVFAQLRQAIAPFINEPIINKSNRGQKIDSTKTNSNPEPAPQSTDTNPDERGGIGTEPTTPCRSLAAQPRECSALINDQQYLPLAQKVYQWLIQPAEQEIAASGVKTLVFVLDGPMLNLPMAVLHDGKQFLIEKYAIAYTPGLNLVDPRTDAQALSRGKIAALKAGLTESREIPINDSTQKLQFPALPYVKQELEDIQSKVPGELLLNNQFTSAAIQKEIDSVSFPIVHLATHGQFSSNAEETFILTWDKLLNVNELNNLLRAREETGRGAIELLVLSACQTAAGDKRAALGLAGVAVRAGARSTLATLWFVNDRGTAELMTRFYRELADTSVSKAEALRRAQVSLLKENQYQQPIYWAPYVLVGNWL